MQHSLKSSLSAKLVASGFIILVISGNIWIIRLLVGKMGSPLLVALSQAGLITVFFGAIGLLLEAVREKMNG